MSDSNSPYIGDYCTASFCFLERARKQIELFDSGCIESLFYAALELRTGIEARLFEYLDASTKNRKKFCDLTKEYIATKLLKKLSAMDANSEKHATILLGKDRQNLQCVLEYTPVTKQLASYHGMLGEILHFKFFKNNREWYLNSRLFEKYKVRSLLDYRDFIEQIAQELEAATRGDLLKHPVFDQFVEQIVEEG
jgi:hypothetical protein